MGQSRSVVVGVGLGYSRSGWVTVVEDGSQYSRPG